MRGWFSKQKKQKKNEEERKEIKKPLRAKVKSLKDSQTQSNGK